MYKICVSNGLVSGEFSQMSNFFILSVTVGFLKDLKFTKKKKINK